MTRWFCAVLSSIVFVCSFGGTANAAGDTSVVTVEVVDASSGTPIGLARVILQGDSATIGYADADGQARFEAVATGSYRASVSKRGFVPARSPLFDVMQDRTTHVRVLLQHAGGPKQIGSVSVTSVPARALREVGEDDPLRVLDGSLLDALGDLPGVTSNQGGFQIDGNDPSQTSASIDGVAIPGAGGALADRGINADLFASGTVRSGAANGSLGGGVAFQTLQPTRFPQHSLRLQYSSDDASSMQLSTRGSAGNVGYVLAHAVRGRTSPFTGWNFTDQTGSIYRHDGDQVTSGDLVKLRWSPSIAQSLTLTGMTDAGRSGLVCTQVVSLVPCGFGPGASRRTNAALATLSDVATIGTTTVTLTAFVNRSHAQADQPARGLAGTPAPQWTDTVSTGRGMNAGLQFPLGDRHDISLTAQRYDIALDEMARTALGTFALRQNAAYHEASLTDRFHAGPRLTLTTRASVNGGDGEGGYAGAFEMRWQPVRSTSYTASWSTGDAGSGIISSGAAFPDPRSLTYDCGRSTAFGWVPSSNADRQRSSSARVSAERSSRRARSALTLWTARLTGSPVLAAADGITAGLPPDYVQAVETLASSPFVCGGTAIRSLAFLSFQPADQVNRGVLFAQSLQAGNVLFSGFALVQSRFVNSTTPATAALSPVGAQVPGTPLHRAGLVAAAKLGRGVDVLANISYTSANNPNRLPAYTQVNAGLAVPLRRGSLAVVARNLTNRHPGPFVPYASVVPLQRVSGTALSLGAYALPARSVELTYTVRFGRIGSIGSGAGRSDASASPIEGTPSGGAFRAEEIAEGPHPNALHIDPDNQNCTPAAARIAQPVLDGVARIAQTAERAKANGRYPAAFAGANAAIAGVTLRYVAYDAAARYAVVVEAPMRSSGAFMSCARFGFATADDRDKFHLYIPPTQQNGTFFIAYTPAVGLYVVPPADTIQAESAAYVTTDDEPASPPADPFALRTGAACPASSRPVAGVMTAALRTVRAAPLRSPPAGTSDVADVVRRDGTGHFWIEIKPRDALVQMAILRCLHVAAVSRAHLAGAGILDARRPGSMGFADRFGLYIISAG